MTTGTEPSLAQEMLNTYQTAGLSANALGVDRANPHYDSIRSQAEALCTEISGIGAAFSQALAIGKTMFPPAAVAAAASAVGCDVYTASLAVGAAALGSITTALTPKQQHSNDKERS